MIDKENFFTSGFHFKEEEELLKYKFKLLNSILMIVAVSAFLFAAMHDLNLNIIGDFHATVDYFYSLAAMFTFLFLRGSKTRYQLSVYILIVTSLITFTSALLFVPQDEFRIIWFFLLLLVTYFLADVKIGMIVTSISIIIILTANALTDLNLSSLAINSSILGLLIGSLISMCYSNKITSYEKSLQDKNRILTTYASTDPLTGISNRRVFNEVIERYFETAQRDHKKLFLMILDLDFFKKINDDYGHPAGDLVLVEFTKKISSLLRKSDTFARIGGEEFAILLYDTDNEGVLTLTKKIHKSMDELDIYYEGQKISVTTSIGISHNREEDTRFDQIFTRCDNALYQSKELGRNQTSSSD